MTAPSWIAPVSTELSASSSAPIALGAMWKEVMVSAAILSPVTAPSWMAGVSTALSASSSAPTALSAMLSDVMVSRAISPVGPPVTECCCSLSPLTESFSSLLPGMLLGGIRRTPAWTKSGTVTFRVSLAEISATAATSSAATSADASWFGQLSCKPLTLGAGSIYSILVGVLQLNTTAWITFLLNVELTFFQFQEAGM